MAFYLDSSGVFVLSHSERQHLIQALDLAVVASGSSRTVTRGTVEKWRELREALR